MDLELRYRGNLVCGGAVRNNNNVYMYLNRLKT